MEQNVKYPGLSTKQAQKRLLEYGENTLQGKKKNSALKIFAGQFKDIMTMILLISTLLSVAMGEITEAVAIIVIVFVNATLGFVQEYRTEKTLEALKNMAAPTTRVIRSGRQQQIPASELVPGDIILIEAGDKVSADARILECVALQCDEAMLTGESLPVDKAVKQKEDAPVSTAFMGTIVTKGRAVAEVVTTGMQTEMGRIAGMLHNIEDDPTPLQRKLAELGKYIAVGCIAICAVVSVTGVLRGESVVDMLITGVSLAVAAVPEGLPAIVAISLALAVNRILKRSALVRRLHSVETLGCANVICTDKTGTLTENRMTVKKLFTLDYSVEVSGNGYEQAGDFTIGQNRVLMNASQTLRRLLDICVTCNNAEITASGEVAARRFQENNVQSWNAIGDPTEVALLVMAAKANVTAKTVDFVREDEMPFDSERKRMTVLVRDKSGSRIALAKGAPDVLINLCKYIMTDRGIQLLTPAMRNAIVQANDDMACSALRVLGFAAKENLTNAENVEQEMIFVGMVGMIDPPRREVRDAVARCRQAKIRTVMITGDHRITACAIAEQIGILRAGDMVMTGAEIDRMHKDEFQQNVHKVSVFARVSPGHKLQIVKALKRRGDIVAMTGDGVNDAPAVKEADIGVAMGITGTDVTKEASSVILLDDNFATLVATVEEGRVVYNNIRKFIRYLLSCNIGEVVTMFVGMLMGMPVVLLPIQILLVNLATDGLPALALGLEPGEEDLMSKKPRAAGEGIFSNGLATTIIFRGIIIGLTTLMVFSAFTKLGAEVDKARTAALVTLVLTQLFHVFECKSETKGLLGISWFNNPSLICAAIISALLVGAVMYLPWLQLVFRTVPLTLPELGRVFIYVIAVPIISSIGLSLPKKKKNDLVLPKQA